MLQLMVILAAVGTWVVTQNMMYAAAVLVVGWILAAILGRILTWLLYALVIAAAGVGLYAYQTGQSVMGLLWKWLF